MHKALSIVHVKYKVHCVTYYVQYKVLCTIYHVEYTVRNITYYVQYICFVPYIVSHTTCCNRRLGGGGAQRPNREIVSFRSCVRARDDCQVEMSLNRHPPGFPFSLFGTGGFPFSLGIIPLLPSCHPALAGFIGIYNVGCPRNLKTL